MAVGNEVPLHEFLYDYLLVPYNTWVLKTTSSLQQNLMFVDSCMQFIQCFCTGYL